MLFEKSYIWRILFLRRVTVPERRCVDEVALRVLTMRTRRVIPTILKEIETRSKLTERSYIFSIGMCVQLTSRIIERSCTTSIA